MKRTSSPRIPLADNLHAAIAALCRFPRWTLLSHEQPDGDTLGCCSAFFQSALRLGKSVRWVGPDPIPDSYSFLPGSEHYEAAHELEAQEDSLLIFVDTTTPERTLPVQGLPGLFSVNIDHHGDNSLFASVNVVDPSAGATAELAWEIIGQLVHPLDIGTALGLYSGLVTDTGRFGYSCTTPRSHRIAADLLERGVRPEIMDQLLYCNGTPQALRLRGRAFSRIDYEAEKGTALTWLSRADFIETGADYSETEGLASELLRIKGSQFSAVLVENETSIRVSLRSRGKISAAEIAHRHGGGGHPNAAGMRLPLPLEKSLEAFREEIRKNHD